MHVLFVYIDDTKAVIDAGNWSGSYVQLAAQMTVEMMPVSGLEIVFRRRRSTQFLMLGSACYRKKRGVIGMSNLEDITWGGYVSARKYGATCVCIHLRRSVARSLETLIEL